MRFNRKRGDGRRENGSGKGRRRGEKREKKEKRKRVKKKKESGGKERANERTQRDKSCWGLQGAMGWMMEKPFGKSFSREEKAREKE